MAARYDLRTAPAPHERRRRYSDAISSSQRHYPEYDYNYRSEPRRDEDVLSKPSRNQISDFKRPKYDERYAYDTSRSYAAPDSAGYRYLPLHTPGDEHLTKRSHSSKYDEPPARRSSLSASAKPQSVPREEWNRPKKVELPLPSAMKSSRTDDIDAWVSYGPSDDRRGSYPPPSKPSHRSRRFSHAEPVKKEKHVHWA